MCVWRTTLDSPACLDSLAKIHLLRKLSALDATVIGVRSRKPLHAVDQSGIRHHGERRASPPRAHHHRADGDVVVSLRCSSVACGHLDDVDRNPQHTQCDTSDGVEVAATEPYFCSRVAILEPLA